MGNENEERYKAANDPAEEMRHQLHILAGKVGELVTAIKGNDLGTEGFVGQIKRIEGEMETFEARLEEVEKQAAEAKAEARVKQRYLKAAYSAGGALLMVAIKVIGDILFSLFATKHP